MKMQKGNARVRSGRRRPALTEALEPRWLFSTTVGTDPTSGGTQTPGGNVGSMPAVNLSVGVVSADVAAAGVFATDNSTNAYAINAYFYANASVFIQIPNWALGEIVVSGGTDLSSLHGVVTWDDGRTTPLNAAIGQPNPDGTVSLSLYTRRAVPEGMAHQANVSFTDMHSQFSGTVIVGSTKATPNFAFLSSSTSTNSPGISIEQGGERHDFVPPPTVMMAWGSGDGWGFDGKTSLVAMHGEGDLEQNIAGVVKAERTPKKEVVQAAPSVQGANSMEVGNLVAAKGAGVVADAALNADSNRDAGAGQTGAAGSLDVEKKKGAGQKGQADPGTFEGEFSLMAAAVRPAREKESEEELEGPYDAEGPAGPVREVASVPARVVDEEVQEASRVSMVGLDDQQLAEARRNGEPRARDRETARAALLQSTFMSRALAGLAVITAFKLMEPETRARLKRGLGVLVWRGIRAEGWEDVD